MIVVLETRVRIVLKVSNCQTAIDYLIADLIFVGMYICI